MSQNMELAVTDEIVAEARAAVAHDPEVNISLWGIRTIIEVALSHLSTAPAGDVVALPRDRVKALSDIAERVATAKRLTGIPLNVQGVIDDLVELVAAAPTPPQTSPAPESVALCAHCEIVDCARQATIYPCMATSARTAEASPARSATMLPNFAAA